MKFRKKPLLPPREEIDAVSPHPEQGLSSAEAKKRLIGGWGNKVQDGAMRTEGQIILENSVTFFNLLFVVMAVLLILAGSTIIKLTFLVVVVINTVIGCVQEIRAKRAVDRLTLVAAQTVTVIRDGGAFPLRSDLLVRDDIVEFSAGNQICADGILRTGQLQVNEALITGEADPVVKNPGDTLLSGSFVIAGRGRAQLTKVGNDAYAPKLAAEAKKDPKAAKSEMMRSLDKLIKVIGFALIPIGAVLFYQEYFVLKLSLQVSAETTAAALVGMVPEGLYLLTSIALAVSSIKLTKKRILVQDMNCIETLSRVDVLCVDKTGTITEPEMQVENVIPLSNTDPAYLQQVIIALYGNDSPENETARALQTRFPGKTPWTQTGEVSFSSEYKWKSATFQEAGAFIIGAPESILGTSFPDILETAGGYSRLGYRVLLAASYDGTPQPGTLDREKLSPMGLVLITNPIRSTAPETFAYFAGQGVAIKVISGDNPATVADVARRAGIQNAERYVDASTLHTEEDIRRAAESCAVFGRVTPDQKKLLIRALKKQGHTVAMTGDGVNDVLAMKEADCGIAMVGGAQAASQIAQLVLLDADFAAMPSIVDEGRRVINNIQRAAALFLVKNIFSLFLSLITVVAGWPYPFAPINLSLISALTIGVPSFFLAMEPNYERVQGRFLSSVLRRALPGGLTNIFVVVAAQVFMSAFQIPMAEVQTVCTAILAVTGLSVLYSVCKPFDKFRKLIWFLMAVALMFSFLFLGELFQLKMAGFSARLIMATLLIMTPAVYIITKTLCDLWDQAVLTLKNRKKA